jgi:fimbrial isopeptide formation D2 family protein/LPXTG-motif cell wall-anchored protein
MKKIISLVLALCMMLMVGAAFAGGTEPDTNPDTPATNPVTPSTTNAAVIPTEGSITVKNTAIGETYTLYKVLTASVGAEGEIVYPGPVPSGMGDMFEVNESGNLQKKDGLTDAELFAKLKTWAATATSIDSKQADSATVVFNNLALGYYVVTSTQGGGSVISVDSTTPDAITYEKNVTVPQPVKTVDNVDYSIGDTITYTVTFPGANYMIADAAHPENAEIVTSYEITDTLPAFLSNAHVQSISIATNPATPITGKDFDASKKFSIDWAQKNTEGKWVSLYPNGTEVTIVYTATLTSLVHVGGAVGNINKVTVTPYTTPDDSTPPDPWSETWSDDAEVKTYAAALKKVDDTADKKPLAGAKFTIAGLTATVGEDGVYTVTKYDPSDTSITPTELVVNQQGMIYIIGLDSAETLTVTETEAPAGYNKLTSPVTLTTTTYSTETYKLTGYRTFDADGNITAEGETVTGEAVTKNLSDLTANVLEIVNNRGTELPSTGGIGTTIFYVLGGLLVVGAAVILVARRKADN